MSCLLLAACGGDDDSAAGDDAGARDDGGGSGFDGGGDQPPTMDEVVTACLVGAACGLIETSGCWADGVYLWRTDLVHCLAAAAGDCNAALACEGMGQQVDPDCVESCEGSLATECSGGLRLDHDCTQDPLSTGPMCAPTGDEVFPYTCADGTCAGPGDEGCDGDVLLSCYQASSILLRLDCALDGFQCVDDETGPRCSDGTAVPCATFDETCDPDANAVVFCDRGYEVKRPCDRVSPGSTCYELDNGRAYCGWGSDCRPSGQDISSCLSATTLAYCAGGVPLEIDCTELGFASCQDERCVP